MNLIGNGIDIVDNLRIKKAIKNQKFIKRIFSKVEIDASKKIRNKISFFAKRFAAKEAFVKALGTGFTNKINFKDISVQNKNTGQPKIVLNDKVKKILNKKYGQNTFNIFLSLSDEKKHSIAFVILNKKKK